MDTVIDTIRAALQSDATPEAKHQGAGACRAILAALGATPGQPVGAAGVLPLDATKLASAVSMLRGVPPDQLLELAIEKLRAALPAGIEVPQAHPLKFQLIPIAPLAAPAKKAP